MSEPQLVVEDARLSENGHNIAAVLKRLKTDQSKFDDLMQAMAQIIPGLKKIDVAQNGRYLTLAFKQEQPGGGGVTFSATEISEGALRALGIIVAAAEIKREDLLLIEEPEVGIHPGAAHLLFDLLSKAARHGAVLITTHSPDLLDAARDEEILVCDFRDGATRIGPLAEAQRQVVKDGLFSVSELMRTEPLRIEGDPSPTVDPEA